MLILENRDIGYIVLLKGQKTKMFLINLIIANGSCEKDHITLNSKFIEFLVE